MGGEERDETLAQRWLRSLRRDGMRWQAEVFARMDDDQRKAAAKAPRAQEVLSGELDVVEGLIAQISEPTVAAACELVPDAAVVLRATEVRPVLDPTVTSSSRTFADGSTAVGVNDGLMGYVLYLAQMHGGLATSTTLGSDVDGERRPDVRAAAVAIRYHLLQRRVWNLPGTLLTAPKGLGAMLSEGVTSAAFSFVIGHELAHIARGHHGAAGGPLVASPDAELEADLLGFEIAARSLSSLSRGITTRGARKIALQGALVVGIALGSLEHALFLRAPATHPPFSRRGPALLDALGAGRGGQRFVNGVRRDLEPLGAAADYATQPIALPGRWWDDLGRARWLDLRHHDAERLTSIRQLDQMCHWDLDPEGGQRAATLLGVDLLGLAGQPVETLLAELEIDPFDRGSILDAAAPLTIEGLTAVIARGGLLHPLADDVRPIAAIIATRLVVDGLREEHLIP